MRKIYDSTNRGKSVRKQIMLFILGIIVILISTPLGYMSVQLVYYNKNLTSEFVPILNGFIHSFMLIGTLLCSVGLINTFRK